MNFQTGRGEVVGGLEAREKYPVESEFLVADIGQTGGSERLSSSVSTRVSAHACVCTG